jgi:hypothetical protein
MEEIIHLFASEMGHRPDYDVLNGDGDNAFGEANRLLALLRIMKEFSKALPYARAMYLHESKAWYYGLPDKIQSMVCKNGFHQGDVLATWLYLMTIHPLLLRINQHVKTTFGEDSIAHIKFFIDDGNFMAPHEIMKSIIKLLQDSHHEFGYKLKMDKGCYLLGKCTTNEEAADRVRTLVDTIGFSPEIIKVHPDNCAVADQEVARRSYGTKMLGTYIGTDEYIKFNLQAKLEKLRAEAKLLIAFPDVQCRYVLFRHCFMAKPLHLMRTTRPDLMSEFIDGFEEIQTEILESLFRLKFDPFLLNLFQFPTVKAALEFRVSVTFPLQPTPPL